MVKLVLAALVAVAIAVAPAYAQDRGATDMQALRTAQKTDKRAYVANALALTDAQGKKFWPIYDAYQRALAQAARGRAIVAESLLNHPGDKPISDLAAKQFITQTLAADDTEVKARRKMSTAVLKALPAAKGARYIQLEGKFRAVQAYDIAQAFPLIE
jgi:Spy/CpxP family protein refolding chaperone